MGSMSHDPAERPDPPRKHDLSFFVVLAFVVAPLWSVVPLSWAFVIYSLHTGRIWAFAWKGRACFVAALCEVFFSVYYYHLIQRVSGPTPNGPGNLIELQATFKRVLKAGLANLSEDGFDEETLDVDRPGSPAEDIEQLEPDDPRAIDFRNVLRTWFGRVPWSQLRVQEVYSWLYWSIFNAPLPPMDALPNAHRVVLEDALGLIEKRSGVKIPKGSNPAVTPVLLTIDKVNVAWRPFGFYMIVAVLNWFLKQWFERQWDAGYGSYKGLEYILRIPPIWNSSTDPRPIVFIHGLGLGLAQYKLILSHLLQSFPDRPLLVLLQPHISQAILHPRYLTPMSRHETADCLSGLLTKLGWVDNIETCSLSEDEREFIEVSKLAKESPRQSRKGVTVLSHSNGSYTHAWILKAYPQMVTRSCFVDPVTFCSWEGDICYNFIYRPCKTGIELIMRYFVGSELGVANLLQRHFDWASNALWFEEIPNARDPLKTMFVLGGKDDIVHAGRVKHYLHSHGVRKGLWYDPNGRHGQALIHGGEGHKHILRWLREQR